MPRAERHSQDNNEKKPNSGLFQRLGKNKPETRQEQPKPHKKLSDIFKKANTPREKEAAAQHGEIKKETRGLLGNLRENIGIEKRQQIRELQKTVSKNPDISKDKEAVRAYQELIKVTDPERFAREIGTVDGVYGNKTRKAYEVDKKTVDNPRRAILEGLSPTPTTPVEKKPSIFNNLLRFNKGGKGIGKVSGKDYYNAQNLSNNCGPTACSIAASKLTGMNAEKLEKKFTSDRPGGMSWDSPQHWLGQLGLGVKQTGSLSASQIHNEISKGNVVVTSVGPKSGLTKGGHIIALVGSRKTPDGYGFVNADPNYNNILRGYDFIDDGRLQGGGAKQYWVVSKGGNRNVA